MGEGGAFTLPSPPHFTFHRLGEGTFAGEGKGEGSAFTRNNLIFKSI